MVIYYLYPLYCVIISGTMKFHFVRANYVFYKHSQKKVDSLQKLIIEMFKYYEAYGLQYIRYTTIHTLHCRQTMCVHLLYCGRSVSDGFWEFISRRLPVETKFNWCVSHFRQFQTMSSTLEIVTSSCVLPTGNREFLRPSLSFKNFILSIRFSILLFYLVLDCS